MKQLLGRHVDLVDRALYGQHGFERTVIEKATLPAGTTREKAQEALKLVEAASRPAAPGELGKALAKLMVKTARRSQGTVDTEATVSAYLEELLLYPADVALAALAQRRQWFPTWAELAEDCDRLAAPRKAIRLALEAFLAAPVTEALARPQRVPGSAEAFAEKRRAAGFEDPQPRAEQKHHAPQPPTRDDQTVARLARDVGKEAANSFLMLRLDGVPYDEALVRAMKSDG